MIELGAAEPPAAQAKIEAELNRDATRLIQELDALELKVFLNGPHDRNNCILSINSGAGGTEACDWASMLMRMYQRWAEARGWEVEIEALSRRCIKSVTMLIQGRECLRLQGGTAVRISPFARQTPAHQLASVDAIAQPGGRRKRRPANGPRGYCIGWWVGRTQQVETAVRITHIPTGLVVASQAQRSQHQNRATAMTLLLSRIYAQRLDAQKAEMERFYGEKGSVSWGNQIRSYVFQPYRMVKDLRTGVETSDVQGVMDGDLDAFVNGWLRPAGLKRMQAKDDDQRSRKIPVQWQKQSLRWP
jgi:peptide chain release factor 2